MNEQRTAGQADGIVAVARTRTTCPDLDYGRANLLERQPSPPDTAVDG